MHCKRPLLQPPRPAAHSYASHPQQIIPPGCVHLHTRIRGAQQSHTVQIVRIEAPADPPHSDSAKVL